MTVVVAKPGGRGVGIGPPVSLSPLSLRSPCHDLGVGGRQLGSLA
jgi:hypothetical protein